MKTELYINNILGAFATTLATAIDDNIAKIGLRSESAAAALVTIFNHPNESIDLLRHILNLTHSGAVRLINGLEEEGLVERKPSTEDRRVVVLRVTKKGQARAKEIISAREKITTKLMNSLTTEQQEALKPILETMLQSLTSDQYSAHRNCRLCNETACRPLGCPVELSVKNNEL